MVKTSIKGMDGIFNKVVNGKALTEKQELTLSTFLEGFTTKEEQPKEQPTKLTLDGWEELTQEQQTSLKATLLKSKYGIGGEHFSLFPTLLDNKINSWVEQKYSISKLPSRVSENTFKTWEGNGTLQILPLVKDTKTHYLLILLPNKDLQMDIWDLEKEDTKPYLTYTKHNLLGQLTFTNQQFHIINSYTNKNKAYNQGKALIKLLQLGTTFTTLEQQKELNTNHLELTINNGTWELMEIGKNTKQPTGNIFNNLGEYLGREQHSQLQSNYLELIG